MSAWLIYFITILTGINSFVITVTIFAGLGIVVSFIGLIIARGCQWDYDQDSKYHQQGKVIADKLDATVKACVVAFILFGIIGAVVPTTKGAMVGVGVYAVTNVDGIEKLPPALVDAANDYLSQAKNDVAETVEQVSE